MDKSIELCSLYCFDETTFTLKLEQGILSFSEPDKSDGVFIVLDVPLWLLKLGSVTYLYGVTCFPDKNSLPPKSIYVEKLEKLKQEYDDYVKHTNKVTTTYQNNIHNLHNFINSNYGQH